MTRTPARLRHRQWQLRRLPPQVVSVTHTLTGLGSEQAPPLLLPLGPHVQPPQPRSVVALCGDIETLLGDYHAGLRRRLPSADEVDAAGSEAGAAPRAAPSMRPQ